MSTAFTTATEGAGRDTHRNRRRRHARNHRHGDGRSTSGLGSGGMLRSSAARLPNGPVLRWPSSTARMTRRFPARSMRREALFLPQGDESARKAWLSGRLAPAGVLTVDAGCTEALAKGEPARGDDGGRRRFRRGDLVAIFGAKGERLRQGLVEYTAEEAAASSACARTNRKQSSATRRGRRPPRPHGAHDCRADGRHRIVGQAVLDAAARRGVEVRALTRRPQSPRDGVTWVEGASAIPARYRAAPGAHSVIHVRGLPTRPTRRIRRGQRHRYAPGAPCRQAAAFRALYSHPRFLPANRRSRVTEHRKLMPKPMSKRAASITPSSAHCRLRPARQGHVRALRAAQYGIVPVPPKGHTSIIHVDDLAECLLHLPRLEPPVALCSNPMTGAKAAMSTGTWQNRSVGPGARVCPAPAGLARPRRENRPPDARRRGQAHRRPRGLYGPPRLGLQPERAVSQDIWQPRIRPQGLEQTARWYERHGWL